MEGEEGGEGGSIIHNHMPRYVYTMYIRTGDLERVGGRLPWISVPFPASDL